jgi:hypothetical protein
LNVINIHVPPLRERRDVPLLVTHFLRKHAANGQPPALIEEGALDLLGSVVKKTARCQIYRESLLLLLEPWPWRPDDSVVSRL